MWIEIVDEYSDEEFVTVTPYAGVWIEISYEDNPERQAHVTPYAGVWIEIEDTIDNTNNYQSHSLCGSVD